MLLEMPCHWAQGQDLATFQYESVVVLSHSNSFAMVQLIIKIDGSDLDSAVIKTQQMELRVLDIKADAMRFEVKDIYGESFNFVPRFFKLIYEDGSIIAAKKEQTTIPLLPKEVLAAKVTFEADFRFKQGMRVELHYGLSILAEITVE